MEGSAPRGGCPPETGGCSDRFDARPLIDLHPSPGESSARTRRTQAASGTSRPGREDLRQLVGRCHLELVVPAVARGLVGPPPQEGGRVAKAVSLEMVVLHLTYPPDPERLP